MPARRRPRSRCSASPLTAGASSARSRRRPAPRPTRSPRSSRPGSWPPTWRLADHVGVTPPASATCPACEAASQPPETLAVLGASRRAVGLLEAVAARTPWRIRAASPESHDPREMTELALRPDVSAVLVGASDPPGPGRAWLAGRPRRASSGAVARRRPELRVVLAGPVAERTGWAEGFGASIESAGERVSQAPALGLRSGPDEPLREILERAAARFDRHAAHGGPRRPLARGRARSPAGDPRHRARRRPARDGDAGRRRPGARRGRGPHRAGGARPGRGGRCGRRRRARVDDRQPRPTSDGRSAARPARPAVGRRVGRGRATATRGRPRGPEPPRRAQRGHRRDGQPGPHDHRRRGVRRRARAGRCARDRRHGPAARRDAAGDGPRPVARADRHDRRPRRAP